MSISTVLMRLRSPPEMPRTIALPTHVSAHLLTAQSSESPTTNTGIAVGPGAPAPEGEPVKPVNIEVGAQVLNAMYPHAMYRILALSSGIELRH